MSFRVFLFAAVLTAPLAAYGELPANADNLLYGDDDAAAKTRCSGEHEGFFVCLAASSAFLQQSSQAIIQSALAKLPDVVAADGFGDTVRRGFGNSGASIMASLTGTNYVVQITGYCAPTDTVLARAEVGGMTIGYNECRIENEAQVAGVLLHEISHNIGFTHGDTDPHRTSVPYFLGDLATSSLGGSQTPAYDLGVNAPSRRYRGRR